jgi:hypothetical protein
MPTHNHHRLSLRTRLRRLHGDERGPISIVTLLVLLVFTMLLVMVTNLGRHADDKLKMQNAADAAAITAGVMLSRGLNGLAHTNHLLCEVFAITAYLREGQERNAEQQVPGILQAWGLAGVDLLGSQFRRFRPAGQAVVRRIPLEQQAVTAFGDEQAAAAAYFLPIFETVLEQELIPEFQRTLVQTVPQLAVEAACETVRRHARPTNPAQSDPGAPGKPRRQLKPGDVAVCVLFRGDPSKYPVAKAIGEYPEANWRTRTLPAIDPTESPMYKKTAREQRRELTKHYLQLWNRRKLDLFDHDARMSRFGELYRIATRGQLDRLLQQYTGRNLPFQIRRRLEKGVTANDHLDQHYHLLAVVYRRHLDEMGPGLFQNPLSKHSDAQSFAQLQIYIPEPRLDKKPVWVDWTERRDGFGNKIPPFPPIVVRDNWPEDWDLTNQNWTSRIMPASLPNLREILARSPAGLDPRAGTLRPGPFAAISKDTLKKLVTH